MRFYDQQHEFYCGVDLHTRKMYLCVLDREGNKRLHRNMRAKPDDFLRAIKPFRDGLVVGVECMFTWYWLADLCLDESLDFVLGHALYMKAIHGGKNKDDRIDSEKIARLMRGGTFPLSYVYPREMRATRDLLRRRTFLMRRRSDLREAVNADSLTGCGVNWYAAVCIGALTLECLEPSRRSSARLRLWVRGRLASSCACCAAGSR